MFLDFFLRSLLGDLLKVTTYWDGEDLAVENFEPYQSKEQSGSVNSVNSISNCAIWQWDGNETTRASFDISQVLTSRRVEKGDKLSVSALFFKNIFSGVMNKKVQFVAYLVSSFYVSEEFFCL